MTRSFLLSACIVASVAPGIAGADDFPNLLHNPGFEELDENGWAVGWDIWPATLPEEGAVSIDPEAPDGRRALRLRHQRKTSYTRAQQAVDIEPGALYFFSFLAAAEMVEPAEGSQGARLFVERPGGGGSRASERLTGSFDWRRVTVGPVSFGNATRVVVMCYLHQAAGTVWYDDVTMIKATPEWEGHMARERMAGMLHADIEAAATLAREVGDQHAVADLAALARRVRVADMPSAPDLRAGPPYSPAEAEMLAIMARLNARRMPASPALVAWQVDPFAPLPHFGLVPDAPATPATAVMGRGETEQIALNLCNLTDRDLRVRIAAQTDADGPRLLLREAVHVQTRSGRLVADPLPRLGRDDAEGVLVLPPGLFRQLWVMIDSRAVPAGRHVATLDLRARNLRLRVPLQIEVLPVDFPAETPVITWGYSYVTWPLLKDRWEQAQADLVAHHINAYCWPARYLPWPTFDDEDNLQPLDWTAFDEGLATHANIRWLLLWPGFEWESNLKLRDDTLEVGSEKWERRFIAWFRAMIAGLEERGLGYDRIAWYLSDEPCSWPRVNAVVAAGEAVRKADPQALIIENPYRAATWDMLRRMDPVVDIWCPELKWAEGDLLEFFRDGSQILWSYQVLPKESPAFSHYRRSFWDCRHKGITGQGFWCYADLGGSNWDPLDGGRTDYAVVYDGDPDELIPSVRWEAWREGTEDYTYLWMLQEAVEAGRGTAAQAEQARRLLTDTVADMARTTSPAALSDARETALRLLAAMQP